MYTTASVIKLATKISNNPRSYKYGFDEALTEYSFKLKSPKNNGKVVIQDAAISTKNLTTIFLKIMLFLLNGVMII
ncbi:MAG: hypothetical protein QM737_00900 [Ferruginibacter sp.]